MHSHQRGCAGRPHTLLNNQSMGASVEAEGPIPQASEETHSHTTPEHISVGQNPTTWTLNCNHEQGILASRSEPQLLQRNSFVNESVCVIALSPLHLSVFVFRRQQGILARCV